VFLAQVTKAPLSANAEPLNATVSFPRGPFVTGKLAAGRYPWVPCRSPRCAPTKVLAAPLLVCRRAFALDAWELPVRPNMQRVFNDWLKRYGFWKGHPDSLAPHALQSVG